MSTDPKDPNSIPNQADEAAARGSEQPIDTDGRPDQAMPIITQGQMRDGSGQRGGYGDSDQTNGMEGATEKPDESAG